jgi:hypothetical protein
VPVEAVQVLSQNHCSVGASSPRSRCWRPVVSQPTEAVGDLDGPRGVGHAVAVDPHSNIASRDVLNGLLVIAVDGRGDASSTPVIGIALCLLVQLDLFPAVTVGRRVVGQSEVFWG